MPTDLEPGKKERNTHDAPRLGAPFDCTLFRGVEALPQRTLVLSWLCKTIAMMEFTREDLADGVACGWRPKTTAAPSDEARKIIVMGCLSMQEIRPKCFISLETCGAAGVKAHQRVVWGEH